MGRSVCYYESMQLNTSRFFSDRLIFDPSSPERFQIATGFWNWMQRIVAWIYSPQLYSEENRRTIQCFRQILLENLGEERLKRISSRYRYDWEEMDRCGKPLLSRDVAKFVIGSKCITVEDINEKIQTAQEDPRFTGKQSFLELDSQTIDEVQRDLSSSFDAMWHVAEITVRLTGRPSEWLAGLFHDRFLADRERLQVMKSYPTDLFADFMHNMVARVIKREMNVGMLIPAYNHPEGRAQYYYVSARLITGRGMVSYILHPAGIDTDLQPIRLFRGTSPRNGEIDALSTVIADLEKDIGYTAYLSGNIFEPVIAQTLGQPVVEAGHSLGATIVQHRLVTMDHIQTAYLYCAPGVREEQMERFNQNNRRVNLIIRVAENDLFHQLGQVHLGYKAPVNVHVDYARYRARGARNFDPHVTIWGREPEDFELDDVEPDQRDQLLFNRNRTWEVFRVMVGPIIALILGCIRDFIRLFFDSRIQNKQGLKIGMMEGATWRVALFRAS